jgi:hypothetical protein
MYGGLPRIRELARKALTSLSKLAYNSIPSLAIVKERWDNDVPRAVRGTIPILIGAGRGR